MLTGLTEIISGQHCVLPSFNEYESEFQWGRRFTVRVIAVSSRSTRRVSHTETEAQPKKNLFLSIDDRFFVSFVCVCVCVCVCTPTEWRQLRGGSLILTDEDEKTKVINGWKRLNTLAHYGVKDSAVMSLVPRRPPTCTLNNGHCKASYRNCESFQILDPVFIPLNSPFPCSMKSLPTLIRFGQTRFLLDISLFFLDCRFFRCGTNF